MQAGDSSRQSAVSGSLARFILLSDGILLQVFLNVPLTTTMLTNGAAVRFLLWYITPRAMFERKQIEQAVVAG